MMQKDTKGISPSCHFDVNLRLGGKLLYTSDIFSFLVCMYCLFQVHLYQACPYGTVNEWQWKAC